MRDFDTAIKWATQAVEKSESDEQREGLTEELESYQRNEPWREIESVTDPAPNQGGGDLVIEDEDSPSDETPSEEENPADESSDESSDEESDEESGKETDDDVTDAESEPESSETPSPESTDEESDSDKP